MPKTGDSVTVSASTPISLSRFVNLKPLVSLTRVVGDDADADVEAMRREVDALYAQSVLDELDRYAAFAACESTEDIAKVCEERICVFQTSSVRVETRRPAPGKGPHGEGEGASQARQPSRRQG